MKNIKLDCKITPITYIHIGSGEKLDPMRFIIKDGWAYYLDQMSCIRYFLENFRKEFKEVMSSGNIKNMTNFFYNRFNPSIKNIWFLKYKVDDSVAEDYLSKLSNWRNQNLVTEFIRTGLSKPFIPGSSIKGALRTALLSREVRERPKNYIKDDRLQADLLGYNVYNEKKGKKSIIISEDPFKFLKVSDIDLPDNCLTIKKSEIVEGNSSYNVHQNAVGNQARYKSKKTNAKSQVPEFMEVITTSDEEFLCTLNITKIEQKTGPYEKLFKSNNPIDAVKDIMTRINEYYCNNLEKEESFFKSINASSEYDKLKSSTVLDKDNECILRVGKGTGQRFCTYEIMNYSPKSRRLIDKSPLGWCKLTVSNIDI